MARAVTLYRVPFRRAGFLGRTAALLARVEATGRFGGDRGGWASELCQKELELELGSPSLLTTSCTHALEMAALLLDLVPGDEVILPSFTHPSTANAFLLRGARLRFCDVRADTLNLDESLVGELVNERTRAIVAVHYGGISCEMDALSRISSQSGVTLIEDNAQGLFGRYRGKPLGSIGRLGALSFHDTKNVTCGEGGALVVNDPDLWNRAEMIRDKGTDQARFLEGKSPVWSWLDVGSSYGLSEILAAVLLAQLEVRGEIQAHRRGLWDFYQNQLEDWCGYRAIALPTVPPECEPAYHLFHILLSDADSRTSLVGHLTRQGIQTAYHHEALHSSPMGLRLGGRSSECPVSQSVASRILRLPFHNFMGEPEQKQVISALLSWIPDSD